MRRGGVQVHRESLTLNFPAASASIVISRYVSLFCHVLLKLVHREGEGQYCWHGFGCSRSTMKILDRYKDTSALCV